MIVCPVCDHPQAEQGACELCGSPLEAAPGVAGEAAPLEGLEPTGHAPSRAPDAPQVDGLEPTAYAFAGATTPAPLELELEPTRIAPLDVDAPALHDLERTAQEGPDDPTPLPVFETCRYCRTPALPGERICGRCGMRLPLAAGRPTGEGDRGAGRICGCGALVRGGACAACGARPPQA